MFLSPRNTAEMSSQVTRSAGVIGADRSTSSVPDPNRLQIVNFALRELGSAGIKSKSDVAKMKAADIKLLAEYLQQHLDHDPQNDCISARRSRPRSILHPPDRLGAVTAKWAPFHTLDC
ncbi:hypothetical protein ABBQ32_012399 [Trebouxia sp. C0010 RCD-2024]